MNDVPHENLLTPGIWTLADILQHGRDSATCPYFTIRRSMPFVDVIIYSFHYLLDPKVAEQVSKEMSKDSIVVFDEAHNIDNVCIESLSIDLTRPMLDAAARSVDKLADKIDERVTSKFFIRGRAVLIGTSESRRQTRPSCRMNMLSL